MPVTRRNFLHRTLVVGPVAMYLWLDPDLVLADNPECTLPKPSEAKPLVPDERKVLERYSAREMAESDKAAQLKSFREAIGKIRGLPSTDVTSWTKQIAQHCLSCAPKNGANIHYGWAFLPWHRALLYFLERILRKQSGDDNLRLIYWDWENPKSRELPDIYAPKGQPLFWDTRKSPLNLTDEDVNVSALLGIPNFDTFGGGPTEGKPTPAVFGGPHALVHNAFDPGDMADLQYSPRDAVFYAHHGNIDRLWTSWIKAGHSNPDFGASRTYFYDEDGSWRYVLFNDLRDEAKLGYKYSSYMKPSSISATPRKFSIKGSAASLRMEVADLRQVRAVAPGPRFLLIESIQNLGDLAGTSVLFGIFASEPKVGTLGSDDKNYLGKVSTIRSGGEIHLHAGPLTAALEVTAKMSQLLSDEQGNVHLFAAPLDPAGQVLAAGIPIQADSITLIA
jgi:polyphenol oxidase